MNNTAFAIMIPVTAHYVTKDWHHSMIWNCTATFSQFTILQKPRLYFLFSRYAALIKWFL